MSARTPGERVRIVVAGEIHENRAVVQRFLEDDGFAVVAHVQDWEGLGDALATFDPDAVVVGDAFLGRDPAEGIAAIRSIVPDARVIAVTASAAAASGADGALPLGVGLSALSALLHTLVTERALAAAQAAVAASASAPIRLPPPPSKFRPDNRFAFRGSAVAASIALTIWAAFALFGGGRALGPGPSALPSSPSSPGVVVPAKTPLDTARQHLDDLVQALASGDYATATALAQALMDDRTNALLSGYAVKGLDLEVLSALRPIMSSLAPSFLSTLQTILGTLLPPPPDGSGTSGGSSVPGGGSNVGGGGVVASPVSDTQITITSDEPDPSVIGQRYTVSWSLQADGAASGTPTGDVTVDDGEGNSCQAAVAEGGCSLSSTSAGSKTLTATYSGDQTFNGSSDTEGHEVDKADTQITITSDEPDPSVIGQRYTVSWSLQADGAASGTPTGDVTVDDGEGNSCQAAVAEGGCSLSSTSAGSKTLTATYSGDQTFNGSSDTEGHEVDKADTQITITSDEPDPSVIGQRYTVSWSLQADGAASGTPTGDVTVDDGEGNSCQAAVAEGGCSLSSTSAGSKTLTATYSGDQTFNGSSDTEGHEVDKADTQITITSDEPDPSVIGQRYTVSWSLQADGAASGTPTGDVTVDDGEGNSCQAAVAEGGCSLSSTSAGSKTLTATYSGDQTFNGSSDTEGHEVDKADTQITITSDEPDPSVIGQRYTVSWSLQADGAASGTPTGDVTVDDGEGNSCQAAVAEGGCSLSSTSAGSKTLTATYSGDQTFNGSSDTEGHEVDKADTQITITSDEPDPSVIGQRYTVSWSLQADGAASGTPTGDVTVDDGEGNSCQAAVAEGGCSLSSTSAGSKTLTATYSGDQTFNGSSDTEGHEVHRCGDDDDNHGGTPGPPDGTGAATEPPEIARSEDEEPPE